MQMCSTCGCSAAEEFQSDELSTTVMSVSMALLSLAVGVFVGKTLFFDMKVLGGKE